MTGETREGRPPRIRWLRDLPIRHKLRAIVLLISGLAVLGNCVAFLTHQWFSARSARLNRMSVVAQIVADQSAAAIEFAQERQAAAILDPLAADPQIAIAAVYDRQGHLFARYLRAGIDPSLVPAFPGADGHAFVQGALLVFSPIRSGDERVGTLLLRSDLSDLRQRLWTNLAIVGLVLAATAVVILFLVGWLGGLVSEPLLGLADVAQRVTAERDYALRVPRAGGDEIGRLVEGFNDMLAQIQARDEALARARDVLERRVEERTRELRDEVAERRATEKLLQEKDERLTEAQAIARLGSFDWDLALGKVTLSDEAYRIYGRLPGQFGGDLAALVDFAHPDDRTALKQALDDACRRREPLRLDYRIIQPDGTVRFLQAQGRVALDRSGQPMRLIGTLQDITERRQADQAIQALNRELQSHMADLAAVNRELEGFSYSVSHDLRAPLRAIDGYGQMLVEDCADRLDETGRRYLGVMRDNTRKMGQLIDDLLAFSRMSRKAAETTWIDMTQLAREVAAEAGQHHPDRKLAFTVGELPPAAGDPAMVRQVLTNLIGNAVKYSRGRDPAVIEVGGKTVDGKAGDEVEFFVRDNGVGFDMQYAGKLFGVFQRLHSAAEFAGTGVGLALVRRIVERHGGRVWAEGKVDQGATFRFTLPAKPLPGPGDPAGRANAASTGDESMATID